MMPTKTKNKKSPKSKKSSSSSSALKETKKLSRKLDRDVKELEDSIYGLKELIHGVLIGLVVGFVIGILAVNGGF